MKVRERERDRDTKRHRDRQSELCGVSGLLYCCIPQARSMASKTRCRTCSRSYWIASKRISTSLYACRQSASHSATACACIPLWSTAPPSIGSLNGHKRRYSKSPPNTWNLSTYNRRPGVDRISPKVLNSINDLLKGYLGLGVVTWVNGGSIPVLLHSI